MHGWIILDKPLGLGSTERSLRQCEQNEARPVVCYDPIMPAVRALIAAPSSFVIQALSPDPASCPRRL